jgi:hypothetical protein
MTWNGHARRCACSSGECWRASSTAGEGYDIGYRARTLARHAELSPMSERQTSGAVKRAPSASAEKNDERLMST